MDVRESPALHLGEFFRGRRHDGVGGGDVGLCLGLGLGLGLGLLGFWVGHRAGLGVGN